MSLASISPSSKSGRLRQSFEFLLVRVTDRHSADADAVFQKQKQKQIKDTAPPRLS